MKAEKIEETIAIRRFAEYVCFLNKRGIKRMRTHESALQCEA